MRIAYVRLHPLSPAFFLMLARRLQKEHGIAATIREPVGPDMTPEMLEAEREAEQKKIDECMQLRLLVVPHDLNRFPPAEPLNEEEQAEKEELVSQGFENWSRRDFQQFVRALETHGW